MSEKNLLSDTDYTKGWDNRFGVSVAVGRVSKIEVTDKQANVRVIFPDRLDHDDQPLISKPIPVLQVASQSKKSFAIPRLNTNVLCVKLPNGTSNYVVLGGFYTTNDPPPVSDPMLDYVEYDDGSTMQFDASTGELTWKIKGDLLLDNGKDFTIKQQGDFNVEAQGNVAMKAQGDMDVEASGDLVIKGGTIKLQGPLTIEGDITHTGNMHTSGVHQDSNGFHQSGAREDLERRVAALEATVSALQATVAALDKRSLS
jgi:phage baseplate assembly protein V